MTHVARSIVVAAALGAVAILPREAEAVQNFAPCGANRVTCASVPVPIDRSGAVPGTVNLHVERIRAQTRPRRGAIFALSGGPGQAATARTRAFAAELAPALATRDLIVFDQRGTGRSDPLRCARPVSHECALEIGDAIHYYTTRDSVEDLEAVRIAVGVERIALYGVSYGTKVAQAYANRYPAHVAALVLDSVVELAGDDFFELNAYAAVADVLRSLCLASRCRRITANPVSDVAKLVELATSGSLSLGPHTIGDPPVAATSHDLFELVVDGVSRNPVLRARLPAAVAAALRGDTVPLRRLYDSVPALQVQGDGDFNEPVYWATVCEELPPIWWRPLAAGARLWEAETFLNGLLDPVFYPFDRASALKGSLVAGCLRWPVAATPPTFAGNGPSDSRVLVLNGLHDLLTPLRDAQRAAGRFPRATVLAVPDAGHAVLATAKTSNAKACVRRALERFFRARPVARCPNLNARYAPTPIPPTTLDALEPWPGTRSAAGRLLRATINTLSDVKLTTLWCGFRQRGLRSGTFDVSAQALSLSRIEFIRGVKVTGTFTPMAGVARLSIKWAGGSGTLRLMHGRFSGRIGGQSLSGVRWAEGTDRRFAVPLCRRR